MERRRHSALIATLVLGLSLASGAPVFAAADNAAAVSRALALVERFPALTLHGPEHTYTARDVIVDVDGTEHVRLDRRYRGLRVIGGDMVVHTSANGVLRSVSKTLERPINVPAKPQVDAASATGAALAGRAGYVSAGQPEQVVYARGALPELAYDVRVNGTQKDGTPSELHVIVSATNGRVMDSWDDVHTLPTVGTNNGKGYFNGIVSLTTDSVSIKTTSRGKTTTQNGWYLRDPSRGGQYTINMANATSGGSTFFSTTNLWGNGLLSNVETVGVDAQYGTAMTWDYYLTTHGRNGIRNDGFGAYNRVHYSRSYNNAFWSDSCFCMTYGDGDGVTFNPFDSLDVAGHEMSHGVTSRTANLTYSGESGGLNEATSDIFGTAVEFFAANPNDPGDYYIGEELYKSGNSALRSMIQPSVDTRSADCWYPALGSLDVHYSSGVANHFFYLLAEGTPAKDTKVSKTCVSTDTRVASGSATLTGIGRDKAEKIWYRALTVEMTSSTNYAGARAATLKAAEYLYGLNTPEYNAVAAAWSAVNVN